MERLPAPVEWLFGPEPADQRGHLWPRWLFLRGLGLIYFSAFYSLLFQVRGLIGPGGILPAGDYLREVAAHLGVTRIRYAPTLLWLGSGDHALMAICWTGLVASVLLVANLWPRLALAVCFITYLSFVSAAQEFSGYQSDGMLLAAGFLSLFFAPPGLRPRLGEEHRPSRASLFLLQWLWLTIYFESGVAKWAGGDPEWRHLTALDQYYSNGPLPNWIGWYAQQLPHGFQASVAFATLAIELFLVWMLFLPRRFRLACFFLLSLFQVGIILTANLAFLNHLVLLLGVLLLDDRALRRPMNWLQSKFEFRNWKLEIGKSKLETRTSTLKLADAGGVTRLPGSFDSVQADPHGEGQPSSTPATPSSLATAFRARLSLVGRRWSPLFSGFFLTWIFYDMTALLLMLAPALPLPDSPIAALEPFRIANQYGLFGSMTRERYEIEFQGSRDGKTWIAYPFRYKPQDPDQAPRIYAPYQPRFDWNLWFASLGRWRQSSIMVSTEIRLLENSPSVVSLFAANPFPAEPPREVRAVEWEYWFTDRATKRRTGAWWRRQYLGLYAPTLERESDGKIMAVEMPEDDGQ